MTGATFADYTDLCRRPFGRAAALFILSGLVLQGCEKPGTDGPSALVVTQPADSPPPAHQTIMAAFARADAGTPEDKILAARDLQRVGAKPLGDAADRARSWEIAARETAPELIDKHPPLRGRVRGPAYREHSLAARTSETIQEIFYAGAEVNISVTAQSGAGDVVVLDPESKDAVCEMRTEPSPATCRWTPLFTMPYAIRVSNTSDEPMSYLLISD